MILRTFGACALLVAAGCEPVELPLAGDAGEAFIDAGGELDAGSNVIDAGSRAVMDAGDTVDAGHETPDAGHTSDAGTPADAGSMPHDAGTVDAGCEISICLTGAVARDDGSNGPFNSMCSAGFLPGLVWSSSYSTFETFLVNTSTAIYPSLFNALDTNGDRFVDANDRACRVNILGYSWGGIEAVNLAAALTADTRITLSRRVVDRLITIDPFQPFASLTVPARVVRYVEFRHSITPAGDCSAGAPLGPYQGIRPRCSATTTCTDYDYSLAPGTFFPVPGGSSMSGAQVGHCEVALVAELPIRAIIGHLAMPAMPPTVPIVP